MKVARIARLYLSDKEARKLSKDLNDVLRAFKTLDKANTRSVEPSFQIGIRIGLNPILINSGQVFLIVWRKSAIAFLKL